MTEHSNAPHVWASFLWLAEWVARQPITSIFTGSGPK